MHHLIPNSEYALIPYGTHCTQLDLPEYVNLRIEKFLKDHVEIKKKTTKSKAKAKKKAKVVKKTTKSK